MINKKVVAGSALQFIACITLVVMYYFESRSAATWKKMALEAIESHQKANDGMRECIQGLDRCIKLQKKCTRWEE